jgi:hypothetical protein
VAAFKSNGPVHFESGVVRASNSFELSRRDEEPRKLRRLNFIGKKQAAQAIGACAAGIDLRETNLRT